MTTSFRTTRVSLLFCLALMVPLAACAQTPTSTPVPSASGTPGGTPSEAPSDTGTPTPTPTAAPATQPALTDLVVTPAGIASLVVGQPVPSEPAETAIATWNPTYCTDDPTAPYSGAWVANYPAAPTTFSESNREPFTVVTSDGLQSGTIRWINVWGSDVATETGVSAGDSRADLVAAYGSFDSVVEGDLADVYVIRGDGGGELWFEVANGDSSIEGYWGEGVDDRVLWIRVMPAGLPAGSMAGGDGGGPCIT
jgi:hypothetical protein